VKSLPNQSSRRSKRKQDGIDPTVSALNTSAKKLLSSIDNGYNERQLLSDKDSIIQKILTDELDLAKGISNGNIVDFVSSLAQDTARRNGTDPKEVDGYSLFTEDVGNLFGYFQELYKNRYIELSDLYFISKFIPALGEAVKTTLDSIVSADDFSTSITRNLVFSSTLTEPEKNTVIAEINRIEKKEHLLKKLRNVVYKKALVSGCHYVYCVPYKDLFSEYDRLVKSGRIKDNMLINQAIARNGALGQNTDTQRKRGFVLNNQSTTSAFRGTTESHTKSGIKPDYAAALENFSEDSQAIVEEAFTKFKSYIPEDQGLSEVEESLISAFENCYIADTDYLVEALEGFSSVEFMKNCLSPYRDVFGGNGIMNDQITTTDGTANTDPQKPEKFDVQGSYIKYIDANHLVPCEIYNQTIGYFHVVDMTAKKKANQINTGMTQTNIMMSSSNIFSSVTLADDTKKKATQNIVDAIAEGIISNFSNKFVNKNSDFKKLIGDCIIANGLMNSTFQIQFIPAKYIVAFPVNEDEKGMGQSILQDSLFPAKMLLSLIVSKLLLYMNKSGSKSIAYIRKGPVNVDASNHVQRTIRMLQESQITFSDLLSTNLAFSKFARYGNVQLPMAKNGDRLIEFETQEGQDVDLHTPMEEFLEKLTIMGSGVPSVILEYTDAADYAKSLVTANIKFAGRCASLQSDLEEPTTELYKMLLETSSLPDDLKNRAIKGFEFKLCRPRVLSNMNMSDYISQLDGLTRSIATLLLGENSEGEDAEKIRTFFIRNISKKLLPFIDWDDYQKMIEQAKIEASKDVDLDKKAEDISDEEDEY